ncbi:MAG: delta 1-pyrroline-5-carboxylate synthetase [Methanobacterium sp. ERen5]|nr:MAG: delta 1-pyrroline-5-carboxylate synthetase [Methanobacterium sp. ERen5]
MDWVLKIGGSLFPEEAINLCEFIVNQTDLGTEILIVCGGGEFANKVRNYNDLLGFSNTCNHRSAIMCMDIIGTLLADKVEGLESVDSLEDALKVSEHGKIPVMNSYALMEDHDPLEHSWRVTSDSIALYISNLLKAKLLIATDVDGIYTHDPINDGAKLIDIISAKKLLNFGETSVDEFLPELLIRYQSECYVVNGKYPERILSIIKGKSSKYTLIGGN